MFKIYRCKLFVNFIQNRVKNFVEFEQFSTSKVYGSPTEFTAKLIPDLEAKLEANQLKHRKHPGLHKVPAVTLPEWLAAAVEEVLSDHEIKDVEEDAKKLSTYLYSRRLPIEQTEIDRRTLKMLEKMNEVSILEMPENDEQVKKTMARVRKRLKCEVERWKPLEYTRQVSLAYLAARLAPNYASTSYVFSQIMSTLPFFKPKSCFDFGSGIGSATWAAHSWWGKSIKEYFCIEASTEMNMLCERILRRGDEDEEAPPAIENVHFRQFLPASSKRSYDLVVSAFSLMELSSLTERLRIIDTLWQKTNDVLVIIESGGKAGFLSVLDARDYITKIENEMGHVSTSGAYIVAPCPHEKLCPLYEDTQPPCHFRVNYYSPFPRQTAQTVKRDVFSYVVLRRGKTPEDSHLWPRIVKPILAKSRKVHCRLCCKDGNLHELVLTKKKHGRHTYRCGRVSSQGDLLPVEIFRLAQKTNKLCENEVASDEENSEDDETNELESNTDSLNK